LHLVLADTIECKNEGQLRNDVNRHEILDIAQDRENNVDQRGNLADKSQEIQTFEEDSHYQNCLEDP
jgi:hypothetical protein